MRPEIERIYRSTTDLINQHMFDEALLYLEEVDKDAETAKPIVEFLRGQVFIAMRDFTRARDHYERSFENDFRISSAEMISTLLLAEGKLENSIEFLENTVANEAENLRILKFNLCKFYLISDRYRDAERIMGDILPGLAHPLPPGIADDAPTFLAAINCELESFEDYPNIDAFINLVEHRGGENIIDTEGAKES